MGGGIVFTGFRKCKTFIKNETLILITTLNPTVNPQWCLCVFVSACLVVGSTLFAKDGKGQQNVICGMKPNEVNSETAT